MPIFRTGTFDQTGLAAGSVDGLVSIDALLFAQDKRAALQEMARVLKPGGQLGVTTWDYHRQPAGRPPQVSDHRPLLREAGFRIRAYEDTDDWLGRQTRIDELVLEAVDELAAESGQARPRSGPRSRRCTPRWNAYRGG